MTSEEYEREFAKFECPHAEHEYCGVCNALFFQRIIDEERERCSKIATGYIRYQDDWPEKISVNSVAFGHNRACEIISDAIMDTQDDGV